MAVGGGWAVRSDCGVCAVPAVLLWWRGSPACPCTLTGPWSSRRVCSSPPKSGGYLPTGEGGELSREGSLGSLSEDAAADAAPSLCGEHWCWEGMDISRIDPRGMIPVGWSVAHMTQYRAGWGSAMFLEAAGFW